MMRARLAAIGLALGIATGAGAQNPAQPALAPATLAGVVRDSTGAPIADAEVVVRELTQGTRTNARGEFTLRDILPGAHQVWFRRLGYRSVDYNWDARPAERTERLQSAVRRGGAGQPMGRGSAGAVHPARDHVAPLARLRSICRDLSPGPRRRSRTASPRSGSRAGCSPPSTTTTTAPPTWECGWPCRSAGERVRPARTRPPSGMATPPDRRR